jgi:dipeptidase E
MRLFLSSENLGNYPNEYLKLVGPNKRLAFVENAKDDWSPKDRAEKVKEHLAQFNNVGFDVFELDLRDYFGKSEQLEKVLSKCGGIFVAGGNTFILSRAFRYSGLDKFLYDAVRKNEIAYGGSSAGSIIATPSLHGTELGDQPEITPKGYRDETIWDGLDFVNFHLIPHYKSSWFGVEAEAMLDYMKAHGMNYKTLMDGQAFLVNGNRAETLT